MSGRAPVPPGVRALLARLRGEFAAVAVLSVVLNILLLGGSVYMMLVYDSVLPSRSLPTLFGLLLMLVVVYAFQAVFDTMRAHILGDVANRFAAALAPQVHRAMVDGALRGARSPGDGLGPLRDLESIRAFLSGPGPTTLIDLPWILFFAAILTTLHWALGVTVLLGGGLLVGLTYATHRRTRVPTERLGAMAAWRNALAEGNLRHAELMAAMGMGGRMQDRWSGVDRYFLAAHRSAARAVGTLGGLGRVGRMLLQSTVLTVGAVLVIDGEASGGVIFASSILAARALAPVDQAIANWRSFLAARQGWGRLCVLLEQPPADPAERLSLPLPRREVRVEHVSVAPPGSARPTVEDIRCVLEAGDALAVIGPSAAGKTSFGRTLLGLWPAVAGEIRLDGAAMDQWAPDRLGAAFGYLPQSVELLEGTVAENIARFEAHAPAEAVIAAAAAAGAHAMIIALPQGYDTPVAAGGAGLSMGQQQRIALARALYRDPFLVVLDEPNSNLDAAGDAALGQAIGMMRARGGIVVVIAHRASVLAHVNKTMLLRNGRMELFGMRDAVAEFLARRGAAAAVPPPRPATGSAVGEETA